MSETPPPYLLRAALAYIAEEVYVRHPPGAMLLLYRWAPTIEDGMTATISAVPGGNVGTLLRGSLAAAEAGLLQPAPPDFDRTGLILIAIDGDKEAGLSIGSDSKETLAYLYSAEASGFVEVTPDGYAASLIPVLPLMRQIWNHLLP